MAEQAEDQLPPEGEGPQDAAPVEIEAAAVEGGEDAPQDSPRTPSDVEDLAREMGWAPQDQWRGNPEQWKDAKTFLKSTVEINRTLSKDVRGLRDTVDRLSRTSAVIADRAIADQRASLEQQFRDAVANGDEQGAFEASQALQRVEAPQQTDHLADFRQRNPWFDKDPEARAMCMAIGEVNKGKSPEEIFSLAEEAVRKRFPEHFQEAQPRQPQRAPVVSSPQSRSARPAPREKGPGDLPAEARRAGEDFVRRGRVKDLAEYARIYFEENA